MMEVFKVEVLPILACICCGFIAVNVCQAKPSYFHIRPNLLESRGALANNSIMMLLAWAGRNH